MIISSNTENGRVMKLVGMYGSFRDIMSPNFENLPEGVHHAYLEQFYYTTPRLISSEPVGAQYPSQKLASRSYATWLYMRTRSPGEIIARQDGDRDTKVAGTLTVLADSQEVADRYCQQIIDAWNRFIRGIYFDAYLYESLSDYMLDRPTVHGVVYNKVSDYEKGDMSVAHKSYAQLVDMGLAAYASEALRAEKRAQMAEEQEGDWVQLSDLPAHVLVKALYGLFPDVNDVDQLDEQLTDSDYARICQSARSILAI